DRESLAGAAAGADAEVRVQLLERRGGDDPRQDRGRGQVAPASRFGLAPEADHVELGTRSVLEVGIVGLPSSGKTTLFNAVTRAGVGPDFGKEHVGMAPIADERLERIAEAAGSPESTPATVRVVDVPGTGPQLLGN